MKVAAIVPAAGKGKRLKSKIDKPYIKLYNKPIIAHTLLSLSANRNISEIIIAVKEERLITIKRDVINRFNIKKTRIVIGGRERVDSVYCALKKVSKDIDYILIHDGIRPFITSSLIDSSLRAARKNGASIAAVPVKPTLKYAAKGKYISYTPDRRNYWEAQTPQVFKRDLLEKAYREINRKKFRVTDDSMIVEHLGVKPKIVMGSYSNIKITTEEDLELAKVLYKRLTLH